jgi:two-component system LytT family response regulator
MQLSFIFIRQNNRYEKIEFSEILYLESCKNYVKIVTLKKTILVLAPLKKMESNLPDGVFCRIHRSYIIALSALTAFSYSRAYIGERALPISDAFRATLEKKVVLVDRDSERHDSVRS